MTEEQFGALEDFIQAKIEYADRASGIEEAVRMDDFRRDLRRALGLPDYPSVVKSV